MASPPLPPKTAMTHTFGTREKPSYAVWLELLPSPPYRAHPSSTPDVLNEMVKGLTPRYWEPFVPHITLSLDFDFPSEGDFLGMLDKIRTAYFTSTMDTVEVRVSASKNKQGNGGDIVNFLNYAKTEASPEGFDALILYLLIARTPTLDLLNRVTNDIVEGR